MQNRCSQCDKSHAELRRQLGAPRSRQPVVGKCAHCGLLFCFFCGLKHLESLDDAGLVCEHQKLRCAVAELVGSFPSEEPNEWVIKRLNEWAEKQEAQCAAMRQAIMGLSEDLRSDPEFSAALSGQAGAAWLAERQADKAEIERLRAENEQAHTDNGHNFEELLKARAALADMRAVIERDQARERCAHTGNQSGTDTWTIGKPCPCGQCERWRERDAVLAKHFSSNPPK